MNHIADANKMVSDTPRTNSLLTAILDADGYVDQRNCPERWVNHARELERESAAAKARREAFKARHASNIAKGKMSAAYWANKTKW